MQIDSHNDILNLAETNQQSIVILIGALMSSGIFFDLASELNGTLFATELRFYGNNRPTP